MHKSAKRGLTERGEKVGTQRKKIKDSGGNCKHVCGNRRAGRF